jgi:tetratricopeptide (TPR) repeat protein
MNETREHRPGAIAVPEGSGNPPPVAQDDPRVIQVLDEYLSALEQGRKPDRHTFVAQHPEIAEALAKCLDGLEFVQKVAPQLSQPSFKRATAADTTSQEFQPTTALGDFQIVREIGRGGMGVVYEAEQLSLGRQVALKVLPFASTLDAKQLQRFKNEAQAAAHLHHQNIVPVYATGCERGVHYYAMQYIEGQTLASLIKELRRLAESEKAGSAPAPADPTGPWVPPREHSVDLYPTLPPVSTPRGSEPPAASAFPGRPSLEPDTGGLVAFSTERSNKSPAFFQTVARLGIQAAEALEHAHQMGVVHRDIKPANLLMDSRGNLWVTDFGLAQFQTDAGLTMTGDLLGTIRYMSPEQALAKRVLVDHRTDVYSLGVTLYELLALEPAFNGRDRQEVLRQIAFEEPRPPRRLNSSIPAELETIVLKAIEKNPAERYATAQELADDLGRYLRDEPIRAKSPTLLQRARKLARRHQAVVTTLAAAFIVLLAAGATISLFWAHRESTARFEADQARTDADRAKNEAQQNFDKAGEAVNQFFTVVSESQLLETPGLESLRKELLETALRYYEDLSKQHGDDPRLQADVAAAHLRVAQIRYWNGEAQTQWFPHTRDGTDMIERLIEEHRDTPEVVRRLAGLYRTGWEPRVISAGSAVRQQAPVDGQQILRYLEKLIHCWEKFAHDHPDIPELQNDLAGDYLYLGDTYMGAEGVRCADKAIEIWGKLVHEHPREPSYRMDLAHAYEFRGKYLTQLGRPEEAARASEEALRLRRELAASSSDKSSYRAWLAVSYRTVGELQNARNHPKEAEKTLRQALKLQEKLVEEFQSVHSYQDDLARTKLDLANVLRNLKRPRDAEKAFREALGIFRTLAEKFPRIGVYQQMHLQAARELAQLLAGAGKSQEAGSVIRDAVALYRKSAESPSDSAFDRNAIAAAYESLAGFLKDIGQQEEAIKCYRQALDLREKLVAESPNNAQYRLALENDLRLLGPLSPTAAEQAWRTSLAVFEKLASDLPNDPSLRENVVQVYRQRAKLLFDNKRMKESEKTYRRVIALQEKLVADFPDRAQYVEQLPHDWRWRGWCLGHLGRHQEREMVFREALKLFDRLAAQHPSAAYTDLLAETHDNLGQALIALRRFGEAEEEYRKAIELYTALPADFLKDAKRRSYMNWFRAGLINSLKGRGRVKEAEEFARGAIEFYEKLAAAQPDLPDFRLEVARSHVELGNLLRDADRLQEAEKAYREAVTVCEKLVATTDLARNRQEFAQGMIDLGHLLLNNHRYAEAATIFKTAVKLWQTLATQTPGDALCRDGLGDAYRMAGHVSGQQEREKFFREALNVYEKLAADFPDTPKYRRWVAHAHVHLANTLAGLKQPQKSEESYRKALAIFAALPADLVIEHFAREDLKQDIDNLANLLKVSGRHQEAEKVYRRAIAVYERGLADSPSDRGVSWELTQTTEHVTKLLRSAGKVQEAESLAREVLEFREKMVAKMVAQNSTDSASRLGLVEQLMRVSGLLRSLSRVKEAEAASRRAVELSQKLAREFPAEQDHRWLLNQSLGELGQVLSADNRLEEAEKVYGRCVEIIEELADEVPNQGYIANVLWNNCSLGWIRMTLGRYQDAEKAYRRIVATYKRLDSAHANDPACRYEFAHAHARLGDILRSSNQSREAEQSYREGLTVFEKLISDVPGEPRYRAALVDTYQKLTQLLRAGGRIDQAQELVRDGIKRALQTPDALNNTAWGLAVDPDPNKRDPVLAVELAKLATEQAPDNGIFTNTLGTAYYRVGKWKATIETLKKAEELYQGQFFSSDAFFIAMAHWQLGNKEVARKWYTAADRWMEKNYPGNEELRRFRAEAAALLGLPEQSSATQKQSSKDDRELYTLILDVYPEAAWAYLARGQVYERRSEPKKAEADIRQALELYTRALGTKPNSLGSMADRGYAYAALGQWDKAANDLGKAVELRPDQVVCYRHALLRLHLGDQDGYRKACTAILDRFGGEQNVTATDLALWSCVLAPDAVADYSRLLQWAEKLLAAQPRNFAYLDTLGAALLRAGRFDEALQRLNEANAIYKPADEQRSAFAYNLCLLAMVHQRLGHAEEARKWLDKAIGKIEEAVQKKPQGVDASVPWNRRLTFQLLRQEAESVVKTPMQE